MAEVIEFPAKRRDGQLAHITRPTPLYTPLGRQVSVAAPDQKAWIVATYSWQPGPGEPLRERAVIHFGTDVEYDVDRASLWVDE